MNKTEENSKIKLVLDEATWRCGLADESKEEMNNNARGNGITALLNEEGYSCCLGQFVLQLNPEIPKAFLLNAGFPQTLQYRYDTFEALEKLSLLVKCETDGKIYNTDLSEKATTINDNLNTSVETKVQALKNLFAEHNVEIEFKPRVK